VDEHPDFAESDSEVDDRRTDSAAGCRKPEVDRGDDPIRRLVKTEATLPSLSGRTSHRMDQSSGTKVSVGKTAAG